LTFTARTPWKLVNVIAGKDLLVGLVRFKIFTGWAKIIRRQGIKVSNIKQIGQKGRTY